MFRLVETPPWFVQGAVEEDMKPISTAINRVCRGASACAAVRLFSSLHILDFSMFGRFGKLRIKVTI